MSIARIGKYNRIRQNMRFNVDLASLRGGGIYAIRNNVDKRVYIGRTRNFKQRALSHSASYSNLTCNSKVRKFIREHPDVEFTFEVLEQCFDIKQREEYYISKFRSVEEGFNVLHNDEEFFEKKINRSAKPKKEGVYVLSSADVPAFDIGYLRIDGKLRYCPQRVKGIIKEGFVIVEYNSIEIETPKKKVRLGSKEWKPANLSWLKSCKTYRKVNGRGQENTL